MLRKWLVLLALLMAPLTSAREPKEFTPPAQLTPDQIAASKAASRSDVSSYGKDVPVETTPFPWGIAALVVIVLIGVTPFAIRSYREVSKELLPGPTKPRSRREEEDAGES